MQKGVWSVGRLDMCIEHGEVFEVQGVVGSCMERREVYISLDLVSHHAVGVQLSSEKVLFFSDVFPTALSGCVCLARAPAQH